ncbi:hypothetical protein GCM10027570_25180 [Streptomonospora sediminis]
MANPDWTPLSPLRPPSGVGTDERRQADQWASRDHPPPRNEHKPDAAKDAALSVAPAPPPEAAAELLRPGEVVWAKLDGDDAVLGSGVHLQIPEGPLDRFTGWRRVEILDPAALTARAVPIPAFPLTVNAADDPADLHRPPPAPAPGAAPLRAPAFPVGAGWTWWPVVAAAAAAALVAALVVILAIAFVG